MRKEDEIVFYIKKFRELDKQRAREKEMVVLTKLIEIDPYCETPYQDFYFNHYYNRGVLYGYLNQCEKAIADYSKAIEINPKHTQARGNRGICYSDLEDLDNAILDITWCLKIDPNSLHQITLPTMYHRRIVKNLKEGRDEKVIEDCNYFIKNFQDHFLIKEIRKILEDIRKKNE